MQLSRRQFLATTAGSAAAGIALAAAGPMSSAGAATAAGTAATTPRPLVHGVATWGIDQMLAFEKASGRFIQSHTYFRSWAGEGIDLRWERDFALRLVNRGTTPVVTFQPHDPRYGVQQSGFSHERILSGKFDPLITSWARTLKAVDKLVVLRPMHEGNGSWYPWCAGVNGNTARSYIATWRHLHRIFEREGATNVKWLWSMNKIHRGGTPLEALYPGDEYVDRTGFSGYNGGTAVQRGGWKSFARIFDYTIEEVRKVCNKPIAISETGCVERGGNKAEWIEDMWDYLGRHREIGGFTWFDFEKDGADWHVNTSAAAQAAYRKGAIATVSPRG